jgi:hypothetical protein
VRAEECRALLREFFARQRTRNAMPGNTEDEGSG